MNLNIAERLTRVRDQIEQAATKAGRDASEIQLLGVAKRVSAERIAQAVQAGLQHVAENYVQEARDKRTELTAELSRHSAPQWHFIGQLQRNKARDVVKLFDCVHSVDRPELAQELDRRAATAGRSLQLLLQVNTSGEPQKAGVDPKQLPELLEFCASLAQLEVVGLMTVPAASPDPEQARPAFAELRRLRDSLRDAPGAESLRELSMGMSADFAVAIEEGASMVRIGTAIFGPREENP